MAGITRLLFPLAILCLGCLPVNVLGQQYVGTYLGPQQLHNRPTVSPYVNLLNQGANDDGTLRSYAVYQTFVRPQLEQRESDAASKMAAPRANQASTAFPCRRKFPFPWWVNALGTAPHSCHFRTTTRTRNHEELTTNELTTNNTNCTNYGENS